MQVQEMTVQNYEELLNENQIVVVDFWSDWCGLCETMRQIFETVSEEIQDETDLDIAFYTINAEDESDLAQHFSVLSLPTFIIFKNGGVEYSWTGSSTQTAFKDIILEHV